MLHLINSYCIIKEMKRMEECIMKVKVEIELILDGLDISSDKEKFYTIRAIEELIQKEAETSNKEINIKKIEFENS